MSRTRRALKIPVDDFPSVAMEPTYTFPATPGMPLFPLSPGRVNAQPQSPSATITPSKAFGHPEFGVPGDFGNNGTLLLHEDLNIPLGSPFEISNDPLSNPPSLSGSPRKHVRNNSDVQAMVSRFTALDIKDHAELRRKDAAALKRAQMGREEVEAEVRRLKVELKGLKDQLDDGKERERKVVKRLDVVMDDLHRSKETQAQAQSVYEKEVRKAKKEAFKSSSILVKLQEELKAARNTLRSVQSELDLERIKVQRREQDTFNAQYELVGIQEEMNRSITRIKVLEQEQQALRVNLDEERTTRITAEQELAEQVMRQIDSSANNASPETLKPTMAETTEPALQRTEDYKQLKAELDAQKRAVLEAEELIEFMKMECQMQCCSCRLAEGGQRQFIHDGTFEAEVQMIKVAVAGMSTPPASIQLEVVAVSESGADTSTGLDVSSLEYMNRYHNGSKLPLSQQNSEPDILPLSEELAHEPMFPQDEFDDADNLTTALAVIGTTIAPTTPQTAELRTVTKTKIVPLVDHSNHGYGIFSTPTGLTREQAIEQLRRRRGRARSVAGTPRKLLTGGVTPRRDISAPQIASAVTPASTLRNRVR